MTIEIREPILLQKPRLALSHLYALQNDTGNSATKQYEAHNYLIEYQSRNIRRKVTPLHQRKRAASYDISTNLEFNAETKGSSVYAVLPFLLYTTSSHEAERLFDTLSSVMAVVALRLRYTRTSSASLAMTMINGNGAASDTPIFISIIQAFQHVSEFETYLHHHELLPQGSNWI
jgi:hypothetical protein